MEGTIDVYLPDVKQIKMWHGSEDPTYHICFGDGLVVNLTKKELNIFARKLYEFNEHVQLGAYKQYDHFIAKMPG